MTDIERLDEEIAGLSETITKLIVGSVEYSRAVETLNSLVKLKNDIEIENKKFEYSKKKDSYEAYKRHREKILEIIMDFVKCAGAASVTVILIFSVLKYEENGALRSKVWSIIFKLVGIRK